MLNSNSIARTVLAIAALVFGSQAQGFTVFDHASITTDAFRTDVGDAYSYPTSSGTPISFRNLNFLSPELLENVRTDLNQAPFRHCDNSLTSACRGRIEAIKTDLVALLQTNPERNGRAARRLLGTALHTVQDFYAHSTWAETHPAGIPPAIAIPSLTAIVREPGCTDGYRIDATRFVSGWYLRTRTLAEARALADLYKLAGFCLHGQYMKFPPYEDLNNTLNLQGIAKDDRNSRVYARARAMAARASQQYVTEVLNAVRAADRDAAICALMAQPINLCVLQSVEYVFSGEVDYCEEEDVNDPSCAGPLVGRPATLRVRANRTVRGQATGDGVRFDNAVIDAQIEAGDVRIDLACPSCELTQWHFPSSDRLLALDIDIPPDASRLEATLEVADDDDEIAVDRPDLPVAGCLPTVNEAEFGGVWFEFDYGPRRYYVSVTEYGPRCGDEG